MFQKRQGPLASKVLSNVSCNLATSEQDPFSIESPGDRKHDSEQSGTQVRRLPNLLAPIDSLDSLDPVQGDQPGADVLALSQGSPRSPLAALISPSSSSNKSRNGAEVRRLGNCMVQSMSRSFPREVWDATGTIHPDAECDTSRERASSKEVQEKYVPRKVYINWEGETEEDSERVMEERQMASLAKESGWSVLDVEEVRDNFLEHSTDGKICLGSGAFVDLMRTRLYKDDPEFQMVDVRSFLLRVIRPNRARARNNTKRRGSVANQLGMRQEEAKEMAELYLNFQEFYFGLTRCLHRTPVADRSRCSIARFSRANSKSGQNFSVDSDEEKERQNERGETIRKYADKTEVEIDDDDESFGSDGQQASVAEDKLDEHFPEGKKDDCAAAGTTRASVQIVLPQPAQEVLPSKKVALPGSSGDTTRASPRTSRMMVKRSQTMEPIRSSPRQPQVNFGSSAHRSSGRHDD